MAQQQQNVLTFPSYLQMDVPDNLPYLSANMATIPTLPSQQTNPLPIFADDLYSEFKTTKTINDLAKVFEQLVNVHEQTDANQDQLRQAKLTISNYFKPYKNSMDQMMAPSENLPKITFNHPQWTFQSYIHYLRTEQIEEGNQLMPIPNGLAYLDARPNRDADPVDANGVILDLQAQEYTGRVEAVAHQPPSADPPVAEILGRPPIPAKPELPVRPGYPQIVTGSPIEHTGAPQIDKENDCLVYIGSKDDPNNIDIPQTLQGFQEYANAIGYSPIHCQHFLERVAKIKWGLTGFDPYKHLTTPTEVANNMLQVTWKPKLMDATEKVTKFERTVGENIYTTYNRLRQSLTQCLSFMPNISERDEQVIRKADKGILSLIHPTLQIRVKSNRSLSNYHHQKHDVKWDLHYIELSESHASHLKPVVPLKLKADIDGINVNFHQLYQAQLETAFPSSYTGVKRPRQEDEPPPSAPPDKIYRPNDTNPGPNIPPTQQRPVIQPARSTPPPLKPPTRSPVPQTPPPLRSQTPENKKQLTPQTARRRLSNSPGTRRFTSSSPGGSSKLAYDRIAKKFVRVPKENPSEQNKPIQQNQQKQPTYQNKFPTNPTIQTNIPTPEPMDIPRPPQQPYIRPNTGYQSRFSPQPHATIPGQNQGNPNQTGFSPARPRTGYTPPRFPTGYSPDRLQPGARPNTQQTGFNSNRPRTGYSPFKNTQYNNQQQRPTGYSPYRRPTGYSPQWQNRESRSPSPGPGRPRYTSTDRPGRTPSMQRFQGNRNRSITPNTAFRQTERNMTAILDKANVAFWKEKICRCCQKSGHSAAICASILCPKCHLTGQHPHDYHCLLARQKHNLLMTAANPYTPRPASLTRRPQTQTPTPVTSNVATLSDEKLLPIINKVLLEATQQQFTDTSSLASIKDITDEQLPGPKNLL